MPEATRAAMQKLGVRMPPIHETSVPAEFAGSSTRRYHAAGACAVMRPTKNPAGVTISAVGSRRVFGGERLPNGHACSTTTTSRRQHSRCCLERLPRGNLSNGHPHLPHSVMHAKIDHLNAALANRYRIERTMGVGGMTSLYIARELRHNREVALRVIKPEWVEAVGAERFLREIQRAGNLQHPHILPLYDCGQADGALFYVMPLVQGESLRDRLNREKRISVEEAVRITTQIAGALDYAHERGGRHRDITPENILLHHGDALLADFGIATAVDSAGAERIARSGLSVAPSPYTSPERVMGARNVGVRSDIYLLAAVTYELLVGEPPRNAVVNGPSGAPADARVSASLNPQLNAPTAPEMIANRSAKPPESLSVIREEASPTVERAVLRALATVPAARFTTAREFAEALTEPVVDSETLGKMSGNDRILP